MVSLKQLNERHNIGISTLITLLDERLFGSQVKSGIYDFQQVPNSMAMYYILISMMINHLQNPEIHGDVIVISTLGNFPWDIMMNHPQFNPHWLQQGRIVHYSVDTFVKLYLLIVKLATTTKVKSLLIFDNIHDIFDLYKLELSNSYQEALLKIYAQNLTTIKSRQQAQQLETLYHDMLDVPKHSDLVKESPLFKYTNHVKHFMTQLSNISYDKQLLIILTGKLDTKFQPFIPRSKAMSADISMSSDSSQLYSSQMTRPVSASTTGLTSGSGSMSSQVSYKLKMNKGRLVLQLSNADKHRPMSQNTSSDYLMETFITSRVIFYKDWYDKTPEYQQLARKNIRIKLIYCAKVDDDCIYFDYGKDGLSDLSGTKSDAKEPDSDVDTSAKPVSEDQFANSSDLLPPSNYGPTAANTSIFNPDDPPSSPNLTTSQLVKLSDLLRELSETSEFNDILPVRVPDQVTTLEGPVDEIEIIEDSQRPVALL